MSSLAIQASAGSGKTFQLSNRFLALLALGQQPGDLIALTFTRKAAGEFARRILNRLAKGASSDEAARQLAGELHATLFGDPQTGQPGLAPPGALAELDREAFQALLRQLVNQLDRLQLSTLDSFFARLTRAFAAELGITGFEMLDEHAHLREQEQVMSGVLNEDGLDARQRELFLKAFDVANMGKAELRVADSVMNFIQQHHQRYLAGRLAEDAWDASVLWPDAAHWPEHDTANLLGLQKAIEDAADGLEFGHKGFDSSFAKLIAAISDYQPGTPLPKPLENLFKWTGGHKGNQAISFTYSRKVMEFPARLAAKLVSLREHIVRSEIRVHIRRTQGIGTVIHAFEQAFEKRARSRGRLGFPDVALLLQRHMLLAEASGYNLLAYRLDSRFRHWMLDEFQDTSRQQWEVIAPVVAEAITDPDGERSLFVVGDTKQAIYGWRNGEPRLFDEMLTNPEWNPPGGQPMLQPWSMSKSYRSSQAVLDFVNLVCDPEGEAMSRLFPQSALERWRFEPHVAAKDKLTGCAEVFQVAKDAIEDAKPTHAAALARLEELDPIGRQRSCAILVTSNKQVREIAAFLRHHHPDWPVETEAAVPISEDNPLGLALLDWFRFLVHPGDGFARRHVELSPLGPVLLELSAKARPDDAEPLESLAQIWFQTRRNLARRGLARHLEQIAPLLREAVCLGEFQQLRLQQILDAARQFEAGGGSLEEWLLTLESLTRSEGSRKGTIQIMTIHKSKGLEFDLVVLPELEGDAFDSLSRAPVFTREDENHLPERYLLRPAKVIVEADPTLSDLRESWYSDNAFERFCNLYVAISRAARHLVAILPAPPKSRKPDDEERRTSAGWIRTAVGDVDAQEVTLGKSLEVDATCLYRHGDPAWLTEPVSQSDKANGSAAPREPARLRPARPRPGRRTATGEKKFQPKLRRGEASSRREAMAFGTEVHRLLEGISRYPGAADPAPKFPPGKAGERVQKALDDPANQAVFNPSAETRILREQGIEALDEDGSWFTGVIDRLHLASEADGAITGAEIIDYKTDRDSDPETLGERHADQLESYRRHLSKALDLPPSRITTRILHVG